MKKVIGLLLAVLFVLPLTVKADMFKPSVYYNENVLVGGIYEVNIVFGYQSMPLNEYIITYDPEYLTIDESGVKLLYQGSNILTDSSVGTVEISNGKITIQVPNKPQERVIEAIDWDLTVDSTNYYLELQFTTLKAGTTKVSNVDSTQFFPLSVTASISDVKIETTSSDTKQKDDSIVTTDEKATDDNTNTTGETEKNSDKKDDNNLLLYCSLGLNALLLIGLIVVALKKKSPKAEAPVVDAKPEQPAVEETTQTNNNEVQ